MKVLLLSVALLFCTGAQGRYFWQQDEPHQEQTSDKTVERVFHDAVAIVTDVFKSLDFPKIAEQYQLKEKLDAARKHTRKLEKALEGYSVGVWKKFDEQLQEKFPTLRKNVFPIFQEFDDALEEQLKKIAKEIVPHGTDFLSSINKQITDFLDNLESIAEKGLEDLRAEVDKLRIRVQPHVDEVHAEYKRYHEDFQGEFQKDYKDLKQDVEKKMEMLKEHAKPLLENIKNKFPDGKEYQEKVDELLKEIKEAILKL
ncbi:hypothetical protein GDO81_014348 [Engystomops pustulosus]|uniref:Apolipoprotein A-I n=1 Tax=Engystomops pustulosus TaxID=76066 RepID=A0AAV7B9Y6_ENGPU|nr:hypothetical protein GDO81_014348 [Engystomops pustulosus]